MNEPIFIAKGTKGQGTGSQITFSYPGDVRVNDQLFLFVVSIGQGTITVDSSWSLLLNGVFPNTPVGNAIIYTKLATGSEDSVAENVDRSGHSGSDLFICQVYQFRSPVGAPIVEDTSYLTTGGSGDTITWEAVDVNGNERSLLAFLFNYGGTPGTPAGYTLRASDNDGGTNYMTLNDKENVSSDGQVTATGGSASGWFSAHVSIYTRGLARSFIVN